MRSASPAGSTLRPTAVGLLAVAAAAWLALAEKPGPDTATTSASAPAATRPVKITYGRGRQIAALANRQIDESSGLAAGLVNPGVFWTHNDSGGRPRLFAFNAKGEHLAICDIEGASARDWEDMCSFKLDGKAMLLIADVGDNAAVREHCTLYAVAEPVLEAKAANAQCTAAAAATIRYRYTDGPRDCEAVGFDPATRTVLLISKVSTGRCKVYALPWPQEPSPQPVAVQAIAELNVQWVTAMDVSPDGLRAVVLTYLSAREYSRAAGESWAAAFARKGRRLGVPRRRQGESICYGRDGMTLYLTSEAVPTPLLEVPAAAPATQPASRARQEADR